MQKLLLFSGILIAHSVHSQPYAWDSDQDAMPDGWELHRQLDPNNPKDAWADLDADGICNLYEYYLGSDPADPQQPKIIIYEQQQPLEDFIRAAPRGVVLRLPAGQFQLNYQHQTQVAPPRLLIQGGWKEDFSERDYCRYRTILDGDMQAPIFDFQLLSGNSSALIIDGCTLRDGAKSAINFTSYLPKAQLLLANCNITASQAHRASGIVNFEDGDFTLISDFIVINSSIVDNYGTGINIRQHANRANFKLLHSLLAFQKSADNDIPPYRSGYGLKFQARADSTMHLQFTNSIFWNNESTDVVFDQTEENKLSVVSQHNIYQFIEAETSAALFVSSTNRSTDPLLSQDAKGSVYLAPNSPAIQAGLDIGFTSKSKPNIGPLACPSDNLTSTNGSAIESLKCHLYPNPTRHQLMITTDHAQVSTYKFILHNNMGQSLIEFDFGQQAAGQHTFTLPISNLSPGLYYLEIHIDQYKLQKVFIKF